MAQDAISGSSATHRTNLPIGRAARRSRHILTSTSSTSTSPNVQSLPLARSRQRPNRHHQSGGSSSTLPATRSASARRRSSAGSLMSRSASSGRRRCFYRSFQRRPISSLCCLSDLRSPTEETALYRRSRKATAVAGATMRYASSMISAISSQSVAASPDESRNTPTQFEKVPLDEVGGLKNRVGALATSISCVPGGVGHHSETRSSLWWSWK